MPQYVLFYQTWMELPHTLKAFLVGQHVFTLLPNGFDKSLVKAISQGRDIVDTVTNVAPRSTGECCAVAT